MSRTQYYQAMKELARKTRDEHGLTTPRVRRSDFRRIYRTLGIRIDLWRHKFKKVRGAYFNDDLGPTVMLYAGLPEDPMVFTMAHELKHHLADSSGALCHANQSEPVEIGAEVFAAEVIFPEADFSAWMTRNGIQLGQCRAETLVHIKRQTQTTLSYQGLTKRAEFMGYAPSGSLDGIKFTKLEEELYGVPLYKRLRRRGR